MELKQAIIRPFTDAKKLLIGTLLGIVPIVNFFTFGFAIECSGLGKYKKKELPEWTDWGNLFKKGFWYALISFLYSVPGLALIAVGVGMIAMKALFLAFLGIGDLNGLVTELLRQLPKIGMGLLLLLIGGYVTWSAVLNAQRNERLSSAFALGVVFKKAFTGEYFKVFFVAILVSIALGALTSWASVFGVGFTMYAGSIISFTLFGKACK